MSVFTSSERLANQSRLEKLENGEVGRQVRKIEVGAPKIGKLVKQNEIGDPKLGKNGEGGSRWVFQKQEI